MPLTWRTVSLHMEWCLDCHDQPEKYLRPREETFKMDWRPPPGQLEAGRRLLEEYGIRKNQLINRSVCHR